MRGASHVSQSAGALKCAFEVDRLGFCESLSVCRLLGVGVVFYNLSDGFPFQLPLAIVCFSFSRIIGGFLSR